MAVAAALLVARFWGPGHTEQPTRSTAELALYSDPTGLFRIGHPPTWRPESQTRGGVLLQGGGQNAVAVKEFDLASRVDTRDVADMRAVTDAILSTPTAHLRVWTSQVVHVGGLTGLYYLYSFPTGHQQGLHAHYFLFSGKRMFTIVCQVVPASGFPRMAPTFDAVARSLVVAPQP